MRSEAFGLPERSGLLELARTYLETQARLWPELASTPWASPTCGSVTRTRILTQLKAKVRRGMDDAFRRGDNVQSPGVGYRMVAVTNPDGSPVITHKGTIEKRAEIDPRRRVGS